MTININRIAKNILSLVVLIAISLSSFAQKDREFRVTKDQLAKINEIAEPIKKKLEASLANDDTYARYKKDLQALNETKNVEQRKGLSKKIISTYEAYFNKVWKGAGVDEKSYQTQIRSVFPANVAEHISFQSNGGFSINNPPPTTAPAPPPPPERGNICINDVCNRTLGEVNGDNYLISSGGGNYGKCFLKAHAWGAVAGGGSLSTVLKNRLAVPGDFPQDSRRLQVTMEYDVKLEATAFAILGMSVASASLSSRKGENTNYMMV
ncbi:MAG TPA: hypothetical protein VHM26_18330, partial [Chitinophagaceae bacterium]|nr:hypothetical protein [Chitinophagaceae bacterium]